MRLDMASSRRAATLGCASINRVSASRVSTASARSVDAVQVAERGPPSMMPISPIRLPGPRIDTTMLSCAAATEFSTVTSPSSTSAMKSLRVDSPSRITTSPALIRSGRM